MESLSPLTVICFVYGLSYLAFSITELVYGSNKSLLQPIEVGTCAITEYISPYTWLIVNGSMHLFVLFLAGVIYTFLRDYEYRVSKIALSLLMPSLFFLVKWVAVGSLFWHCSRESIFNVIFTALVIGYIEIFLIVSLTTKMVVRDFVDFYTMNEPLL